MQTITKLWPKLLNSKEAAAYLREVHGIPVEPKTMRNQRHGGRGPKCQYYGTIPLYTPSELDRWATEEALTDESPITRTRRIAKAANGRITTTATTP